MKAPSVQKYTVNLKYGPTTPQSKYGGGSTKDAIEWKADPGEKTYLFVQPTIPV